MLVLIDELVNIYKVPHSITRQYNYEKTPHHVTTTPCRAKAQYLGIISGVHSVHRGHTPRRVQL